MNWWMRYTPLASVLFWTDWYLVVDTSDSGSTGIFPQRHEHPVLTMEWWVQPHTAVIFECCAGISP